MPSCAIAKASRKLGPPVKPAGGRVISASSVLGEMRCLMPNSTFRTPDPSTVADLIS